MKKTALLLALVMCITSVEAVRADSTQSYDDYTACLEENLNQKYTLDEALEIIENESSLDSYVGEIFEDVDNFDSMVFTSCGDIDDIHLNNEQLIYVIDYGIVEDEIQVMSRADEYTEYQVLEGDKVDTIVYYNNGTVYLNDELLKNEAEDQYIHTDDYADWWSTNCPYGNSTDYTYKIGSKNDSDVENTKYWNNLTYTAFSLALTKALPYLVGGYSGAVSAIVSLVYAALSYDDTPYTKCMSYKMVKYNHKDKTSGVVKGTLCVTKYVVTAYAAANYQNKMGTYDSFYCKEHY